MEIIAFALGCIVGLMVHGYKFDFKPSKVAHEVEDTDKEVKERNKRQLEHMQALMSYDVTQAYKMGVK
jgi:hypothetical protein